MLQKIQDPSFNTWAIVFLLFGFQGLITGTAFLLNSRKKNFFNRFIGFILFTFSLTLFTFVALRTGYIIYFPFLGIIGGITPFIYGPLIYFYFSKLTRGNNYKIRYGLHFIFAGVIMIYFIPPLFLKNKEEILSYLGNPVTELLPWLKIIHLSLYGYLAYRIALTERLLNEIRRWARLIFLFYAGFVFTEAAGNFSGFFPGMAWDVIVYLIMSAFISFVALFAYIQPKVFEGYSLNESKEFLFPKKKYQTSGLTDTAAAELFSALEILMDQKKSYRENDIRLEKLAIQLNTNRHHLSQVINDKSGLSFFEYINKLRIEEAMILLSSKPKEEMNIIEVAYRVGFNNKVTFNNAFKRVTGITPTEYRTK